MLTQSQGWGVYLKILTDLRNENLDNLRNCKDFNEYLKINSRLDALEIVKMSVENTLSEE